MARIWSAVLVQTKGAERLNPRDEDVPEIGDELAVARSLSDLAHRLLHAAADHIEGMTHENVHLHRGAAGGCRRKRSPAWTGWRIRPRMRCGYSGRPRRRNATVL